jgi:hypothetical protein
LLIFQLLEKLAFARVDVLAFDHLQRSFDNRHRPGSIEEFVGAQAVRPFQAIAGFCPLEFQRHRAMAAAPPPPLR